MPKPPWVNFAEIRERVSLEDVIFHYYKIEGLTRSGDKLVGACPVHGGDSPRAFHADLAKKAGSATGVWHCFSRCKGGGNALDFVMKREGIGVREAALRLKTHFADRFASEGTGHDDETPEPKSKTARPLRERVASGPQESQSLSQTKDANPSLKVRLALKREHPYLTDTRGLGVETLSHFEVGYCSRGTMRGMVAFPVHDQEGERVAYAGRRLKKSEIDQYGKWKFPKGFRKELELFNFHRAREHASEHGLILVEGFFGVLALHEAGFENAVASMGCEVSERQLELLCKAREVVVLFDGDEAGRSGAESVCKHLAGRVPSRLVNLPDGLDPEDLDRKTLRWLVNGVQGLKLARVSFSFEGASMSGASESPPNRKE